MARSTSIHGPPAETDTEYIAQVTQTGELKVTIVDPTHGGSAKIDPATGFLVTSDHNLNAIHAGKHFTYSAVDTAVSGAGTVEMLLRVPVTTPETEAHVHFFGAVSSDMIGYLFEDPTTSADGTPATPKNRHRASVLTPNMLLFTGPTVTADGTQLTSIYLPGGKDSGGQGESFAEWVLDAGDYLIRVENISGQNNAVAMIQIEWHEDQDGI